MSYTVTGNLCILINIQLVTRVLILLLFEFCISLVTIHVYSLTYIEVFPHLSTRYGLQRMEQRLRYKLK